MKLNKARLFLMSLPVIAGGLLLGTACTDDFEAINTSGIEVDPDDLPFEAQFAEPMNYCYPPQQNMFQFWTNLTIDLYSGYFMTPNGGFTNGDMGENRGHSGGMYENYYLHIFNNTRRLIAQCEANGQMGLAGVMRVVQAYGTLMTTDAYGPIAYSSVLAGNNVEFAYDSQKDIYKAMLQDLEQAIDEIKNMSAAEKTTLESADTWLAGDTEKWVKVANQFRLRMAMRLTKRGQEAKEMGVDIKEIARQVIEEDGGVLTEADGDVTIAKGLENEMWLMIVSWGDCGFGADLVTMMVGMDDPRLPLYMTKNRDITMSTTNDAGEAVVDTIMKAGTEYIGIPFASGLPAKPNAWSYFSNWIGEGNQTYYMPLPIMKCAEGYFLRAEAKLRWGIGSESVEQLYKDGIKASINSEIKYRGSYVGITSSDITQADIDAYTNGTGTQIDYIDPAAHAYPELLGSTDPACNDRVAENDLCVAWDEGATDEEKLQRIITQKYFALFPLSIEAWAEQRRTGYPILFKGRVNESNRTNDAAGLGPDGNAVNTEEGVRRVIYSSTCYDTNGAAMNDAIRILNEENTSSTISGDHGGTRVWWDNANVGNFENDGD